MSEEAPMTDPIYFPGATPRDLLAGVLDWTDRHPDDPRLPAVLVAAIRRTLAAPDPPEARAAAEAWAATYMDPDMLLDRAFEELVQAFAAFGAAREAATREAAARIVTPIPCGSNPVLPAERVGCGQMLTHEPTVYRCADCSVPFHRDCLRRHVGAHPAPAGDAPAAGQGFVEAQCAACGAGHDEATERGAVPPIVRWPCGHDLCWHCDQTSRVAPWQCLGCEARAGRRGAGEGA